MDNKNSSERQGSSGMMNSNEQVPPDGSQNSASDSNSTLTASDIRSRLANLRKRVSTPGANKLLESGRSGDGRSPETEEAVEKVPGAKSSVFETPSTRPGFANRSLGQSKSLSALKPRQDHPRFTTLSPIPQSRLEADGETVGRERDHVRKSGERLFEDSTLAVGGESRPKSQHDKHRGVYHGSKDHKANESQSFTSLSALLDGGGGKGAVPFRGGTQDALGGHFRAGTREGTVDRTGTDQRREREAGLKRSESAASGIRRTPSPNLPISSVAISQSRASASGSKKPTAAELPPRPPSRTRPSSVAAGDAPPAPSTSSSRPSSSAGQSKASELPLGVQGRSAAGPVDVILVNGKAYQKLNVIGRGGSSKVWQVFDSLEQCVKAVKVVDLGEAEEMVRRAFENEISLLKSLQPSDKIIRLFDHESRGDEQYLVMEKGDTDMGKFLKGKAAKGERLSDAQIESFFREMLLAVAVIHEKGIIHSDLKPANFLLVGGNVKLIDFGIASAVPRDKTSVTIECQMGTLNYMSPEAIKNAGNPNPLEAKRVTTKSDVWSLGCILYSMAFGRTPFQHISSQWAKMRAIMGEERGQGVIQYPHHSNKALVDLIKKCLIRDTRQRPSVKELLGHDFFTAAKQTPVLSEAMIRNLAQTMGANSPRSNERLLKQVLGVQKGAGKENSG